MLLIPALALVALLSRDEASVAEAVAALEKVGASVLPIAKDSSELVVNFSIGGKEATDADLAPLAKLAQITELNLGNTRITDAGLRHVAGLTNLTRLYLHKTAVTGAGLQHLCKLEKLQYLNLYGSKVDDAGLEHLAVLNSLRKLFVWQTAVTEEGAAKLNEALPELVVNRGFEAPPPAPEPEAKEPTTCCEKAAAKDEACTHPCCVEAAKAGKTCFACNPELAKTCCEKAAAKKEACAHPCCVEAAKNGEVCKRCNPLR